ncbi:hypothetical protein Q6324_28360, partial [Klebsiella pneumoniae]|uniref:hypothetical protein n=1 Tax=Klebsiella pneumoniae TaxID=573 RepID=UPI00272F7876
SKLNQQLLNLPKHNITYLLPREATVNGGILTPSQNNNKKHTQKQTQKNTVIKPHKIRIDVFYTQTF